MAQKRIIVNLTDQQHANLIVKLKYDGLAQTKFMRAYINAYLKDSKLIRNFINDHKEKNKVQNKKKRSKQERILEKKTENENKFGLNTYEIEDIFDLIQKEHPEL